MNSMTPSGKSFEKKNMQKPFDVRVHSPTISDILSREIHGKPLVYLDNGASAQKPQHRS